MSTVNTISNSSAHVWFTALVNGLSKVTQLILIYALTAVQTHDQ